MISNITNALPALLKKMKDEGDKSTNNLKFNLIDSINFYNSIMPKSKEMCGLKHMYLDCIFTLNDNYKNLIQTFTLGIDSIPFLKEFEYELDLENNRILIRSNYEELAILSLILIGSIKSLSKDIKEKNEGIFISLAMHFMLFCIDNSYNVCKSEDIKVLEEYNGDFDKKVFKDIVFIPTSEKRISSIHFIGVELNKDIMKIFEKYKNVKFSFNEENASFIITMKSQDWKDFWNEAPTYLKDEFKNN